MRTLDANGLTLDVYLFLIEKAKFDTYGEIYNLNEGYSIDIETLEPALEWRLEEIEKEEELNEEKQFTLQIKNSIEPKLLYTKRLT